LKGIDRAGRGGLILASRGKKERECAKKNVAPENLEAQAKPEKIKNPTEHH